MSAFSPWQQRAFDQAVAALDAGRLGHGMLICGPAGLGKREVALKLAEHVLSQGADAAANQRAAQLIAAGTHPDLQLVSFIPNRTGDKLRTEIVIEQVREVSQKLALTPQYGIAQVVVIDPADAINRAACNALLKTLEEPAPGRYLWLVSAHPARLPATIRSRCQRLEFKLPPAHEALAWLLAQGFAEPEARQALDAARGHPGLAAEWLRGNGLELRRQVAADLEQLGAGRAGPVEVALRWTGDEQAEQRLAHAADLVLAQASSGLTDPARLHKLAAWFDAANRTRELLRTTVRADLAVTELLLAWRDGDRAVRKEGSA
ncbi:MAG: DNA polymerase III subunit delta' [Gammaproteobacteria bacterium]